MKKVFLLVCLVILGYTIYQYTSARPETPSTNKKSTIRINETVYTLDLADTDSKRTLGLSGRPKLGESEGMLFLFDQKDLHAFWMKDMLIPLDIIWINDDNIIDITENVPIPLTATYLPRYQPKAPVNRVLEVNAGEAKRHGFVLGQKVELTLIKEDTPILK